jgi:hypothetical protein
MTYVSNSDFSLDFIPVSQTYTSHSGNVYFSLVASEADSKNPLDDILFVCKNNLVSHISRLREHVNDNIDGDTPLAAAIMYGHKKVLKELLKHGADVRHPFYGDPLILCCDKTFFCADIANILLENGSSVHSFVTDGCAHQVRDGSIYVSHVSYTEKQYLHVLAPMTPPSVKSVKFFISRGADPTKIIANGMNAIDVAVARSWFNVLEFYLKSGYVGLKWSLNTPPIFTSELLRLMLIYNADFWPSSYRELVISVGHFSFPRESAILAAIHYSEFDVWAENGSDFQMTRGVFNALVQGRREELARERWDFVIKKRAAEVCISLQHRNLSANSVVEILKAAFPGEKYDYEAWWKIACAVKHAK